MKTYKPYNSFILASALIVATGVSAIEAASLYWSSDGLTLGSGGSWDTGAAKWGPSPAGPFSSIWSNAANDTALFAGPAGSVTLNTGITVGGLRFHTSGYSIDASTNPLSFGAANNTILLAGSANATITGSVGGTGNVAIGPLPALGRVLTLNGTSIGGWSGTTTAHLGSTLSLAGSNQALLQTSGITLNGGGITLTNTADTSSLDRVGDLAAITANGGVFTYSNPSDANNYTETVGTVALALGQTGFSLSTDQLGGGSQTLTLSGLTRTGAANTSSVAFSAAGTSPNATTNRIVVTGAPETPANQIRGPWATTGTSALVQTNYAVFDDSSRVLPANIIASTQDTWTNSSNAYTSSNAVVTLTGNRSMTALRNTGATATITLSDGTDGFNLATNGILNAVNSQLTIAPGTVPGALTAPGTGGGHIYVNTGGSRAFAATTNNNTIAANLSIEISAPINDNGGPVTLVKTGDNSVLRLSGTKNYSGGTVVNAGILFVESDAALGASSGKVTLNGGQLRCVSNNTTFNRVIEIGPAGGSFAGIGNQTNINFTGKLTGAGTFNMVDTAGAGGRVAFFNSTENDFTGAIFIPANASTVRFNSLPDSSGAGDIILYRGGQSNPCVFQYGAGAVVPLTLNHRSVQIVNNSGTAITGATITNLNTTHPITINTDLVSIGSTARTLVLDAAAGPTNSFAGKLTDGTGGGVLSLTKNGAGTWALSGNNTYTGATTVSAGTLLINGNQSAASGAVAVNGTSTLGGSGTIGGPVTVAAGAKIAPGTSVGTLTVNGGLDISAMASGAGTLNFELGPIAASDRIAVGATLTIGSGALGLSDFVFTNLGGLQTGVYKLITSGAPVSGTLNADNLTGTIGDFDCELRITGNDIELVVSPNLTGDYATWASQFLPTVIGLPTDDHDGDGVSNDDERIFGLNPTNGTSSNPITVPLDSSAGTFSFTRRDPSLTGLLYQVWTSTDLVAWEIDGGASLTPGAVVDNVQTVAVEISEDLLVKPRLFLRIGADAAPPLLTEDFEDDDGGFTVSTLGGTAWAHGVVNSPTQGGGAVTTGNSGTRCWATNLTGGYAANTDTSLRSPVIDLTDVTGATLSFARAIDALAGHTLEVNVIDDATDTVIANIIPAAEDANISQSPWESIGPVALPGAAYGQAVRIEWRFIGNGDGSYNGAYIDDVVLAPSP